MKASLGLSAALVAANAGSALAFVSACLADADVPYFDSCSTDWSNVITPYNRRLPGVTPSAVVYATETEHVQEAVRCAAENDLKVSVKSGGHNYANFGMGGEDGHVVVQLDRMPGVVLHEDNTATINAGTRLGRVALELYEQGGRGISHGTCPGVGMGGHAVHGGFGMSSYTHGLASDWVIGASVVLDNGTLVHTSATENEDLFWAIRGAGSSFGIVVDFEVDTFAVPPEVTWMTIDTTLTTAETALAGMLAWQDYVENTMPSEMNMRMFINSGGARLEILYHGSEADARAALEPLEEPLGFNWNSFFNRVGTGNWLDQMTAYANGETLNQSYPYTAWDNMYVTNLLTRHIPETAMESFVDYWFLARAQRSSFWLQMDAYGGANSAVSAVPASESSYAHRDKLWLFQFSTGFRETVPFMQGFADSLKDNMAREDWGRYINYVDSELTREEAQQQYYAENLARLQQIKAALDPNDRFYYPQSIVGAA
ncbi:hypothetical protein ACRALDRAFT_1080831 [Sodiomyces alcalophilus JCM 7366]|uniref:uncharacterized protein n=1 Tax=Sodiomyces alcalophilus JCM 7366 TaxID=591952 RepID=UPI0039B59246